VKLLLDTHAFLWFIALAALPLHHRDPFDRLLAAQSLVDGLVFLSADQAFDAYGVQRRW